MAAWGLALYLARIFIGMGWIKFDPQGFWTAAFERWGYPAWFRVSVGAVEVAGGVLILLPWTATYGALALALVMVGAWGTRAHDGRWVDVAWITAYLAGLVWIGLEYRGFRLWPGRRAGKTTASGQI